MRFQTPLVPARLIRRYKRFLADVALEADGRELTVHCPNPGAMTGLAEPGMRVWLEPARDARRKLPFAWRLVELGGGHWAGIDATLANRVVREALEAGQIAPLSGYEHLRAEVRYGEKSRIDFLLAGNGRPDTYVEVKNVHLRREGDWAEFPDSVTARGTRHLRELAAAVGEGHRAVMLYLVQRTDCTRFRLAADIDPAYAAAFAEARAAGVEALAFGTRISPEDVTLAEPLPIDEG
ncbi:sugar fermentation stimulation protein A [Meinhardsimonia xiamenensis]|jgi:sugar fermentation stimulation protein A|uniref:Sugar fermentation stimulation protein homolog n=1 Tax=Meinhardsimonia xiamenensis TaxID=990712 RepID=A0A1G8XXL3_9RHOB|nr:DNA/RNA nuclease SfsA [Meinhardsimonia xiamenensis]PRX37064.1 sugar fermentation stimulation protein A [Meinhardsimonia xiamenensis]SDJ94635.1 sugar fermentation stimulation protein A [Meinhardsimonia xiamenensis]